MIKTKRIKRNWGEEDIKILLWIISKYCDWKGYNNIEKELVTFVNNHSNNKTGNLSLSLFQVLMAKHVCLNGLV